MRSYSMFPAFVLTALVVMLPTVAIADAGTNSWRAEADRVRGLAENDVPAAYKEALRLQSSLLPSASATDQVRVLNLLARIEVYLGETAAAERHAKEAFDLALQSDDRAGQAEADLNDALNTVNQGRFDAMSEAVKHAMDILAGVDRPDLLGEAMLRTSMMFRRFERFDDSVEVAMHAMDIAQRGNNPSALVYAYQGMAIAYEYSARYDEAHDYYTKMLRAAQDAHSILQEGDALLGLGFAVTEMGNAKSGERLIRDGIWLYRKAGGSFYLAHGLHSLAFNLRKQGRLAEAQTTLNETVSIYKRKSNNVGLWWALNLRSQNFRELGRITEAEVDADWAYKLAVAIGHPLYLSESVRMKAVGAAETRDFERAYRLSVEAIELSAKSAREKASVHMLDLATRYENESYQRQIKELTRSNEMHALHQRWLWTVLVGSLALLLVSVMFLLRLRRSREEVRKLNAGLEQRVRERTVELQHSQQSLAARERELRALADSSPGMMGSFHLKPDGSMYMPYVAPNIFEQFGLRPQDVAEDASPLMSLNHPDDAQRVMDSIAESARTVTPWHCEYRIQHPTRGERWMEGHTNPQLHPDGGIIWYGYVHDITGRKRLEAELLASRNFLDSVIGSVSDPIFVKDRQHRWSLLNDAFCTFIGHAREELVGKSDHDYFPKKEADVFWEKDELVFHSGKVNLNEENFTSTNGEEHFIQTKKTPFVSGDGQQMLVGVIRDITERKHYEEAREVALAEARRLADLRSEFIAHMSHELRTPLNGILGYAQILGRDGKLNEKQLASVDVIHQSGEHLLELIEDILDLARIESGKLELDIGDIPLARFLDLVSGIVAVRAKQRNIEFTRELAPDLPQGIRGDEKRLRQVLLNLLSNGIKFTDSGRVTLRVSRLTPSRLVFEVADTGIGIAPLDREAIFQSFEQVSDARHRIGGTGLGLSISRQLVRLMGGEIEVESHVGEGSTFRFELELPQAKIGFDVLRASANDTQSIEPAGEDKYPEQLFAPPLEEIQELHRLALQGNMRDILQCAERIGGIDPCYRPFSAHLKRLAGSFQSKAILAFVEGYLI